MRLFKTLAILQLLAGSGMLVVMALAGLAELLPNDETTPPSSRLFLAWGSFIPLLFVFGAVRHLRKPSRKTAISVAGSTAALIWIVFTVMAGRLGATNHIYTVITMAAMIVTYFRGLKPMAEASFPAE